MEDSVDWRPSKFEEASEEYFERRCAILKHFTHRYRALNPEYDSDIETAHDYSNLEFQDGMAEAPENVQKLADAIGCGNEKLDYKHVVRTLQDRIASESAALKLLNDEYPVSEELEERISGALDHVIDLFHKDYHRRGPENRIERDLLGSDGELLVHEGELFPLPEQIEMSYNSIKGEDEAMDSLDSPVTPFIDLEPFFDSGN